MRQKYLVLKDTNEHLLRQLENGQQQLDQLNVKKEMLEEVSHTFLAVSSITQCLPHYICFVMYLYTMSLSLVKQETLCPYVPLPSGHMSRG